MQYHEASLLKTAANKSQWPVSDLPEIVFAGRSNAGKSSLINALVNRSNLAYAGKTPGKTRLLNFFLIDNRVVFCDAPGYGYAVGNTASAVPFHKLIDPYLEQRTQLAGMIIVLDSRRTPNADDIQMAAYGRSRHIPVLGVCTKADKLSRSQLNSQMKIIAQTLDISRSSLLAVDNLKKTGMDEVWEAISRMTEQYSG